MAVNPIDEALASLRDAERKLRAAGDAVERTARPRDGYAAAAARFEQTLREALDAEPLDLDRAARRAALQVAAATVWADRVGPLLGPDDARLMLGDVSRQRLSQLARDGHLIALEQRDGRRVFPAWQFERRQSMRALGAVHRMLVRDGHLSPWTAASWCVSPHRELDGRSPRELLTSGQADGERRVAAVARRDAARAAR